MYRTVCGESVVVNPMTTNEWNNRIPSIISEYERSNICRADETGLFFKVLSDKSLVVHREECKGRKRCKERYTILLYVNSDGIEKQKPLVINEIISSFNESMKTKVKRSVHYLGENPRPRCFRNLNIDKLLVPWKAKLFENSLFNLNLSMKKQNRYILLFLDNALRHPPETQLSRAKLQCFSVNSTSIVQPLDQWGIHSSDAHYRKSLIKHFIAENNNQPFASTPQSLNNFSSLKHFRRKSKTEMI